MVSIFFRVINHRLNRSLKNQFCFDFWNFLSCLINHAMIKKLFFFKVLLNLIFGIAVPYKQISICLYKHWYAPSDILLLIIRFLISFCMVVGCRYFFFLQNFKFYKNKKYRVWPASDHITVWQTGSFFFNDHITVWQTGSFFFQSGFRPDPPVTIPRSHRLGFCIFFLTHFWP